MRAEINPRQRRTRFGKAHFHPGGQLLKIGLGVVAAADARLIGNDNELEARVVQTSRGVQDAWDPVEILDLMHVRMIDVDHAVAIEKCGSFPGRAHLSASTFGYALRSSCM